MVARKVRLTLMILLTASALGCSAGTGNRLAIRPEAPPAVRAQDVTVARIVQRINQNAEPADAMMAYPSVTANSRVLRTGLSGKIVLERQGNFMMELDKPVTGSPVVHLGSNNREYWLWMRDENNGNVMVGDYQSGSGVPSELMFQPEWVIEALGLRTISPDEESKIKLEPRSRSEPGTLLLTHYRDNGKGSTMIKQTVVDEQTGRVLQHRFYANDQRRPVAVAVVSDPVKVPIKSPTASGPSSVVEIPQRVDLTISPTENRKEDSRISMSLSRIQLTPSLDEEARQAWFSIPQDLGKVVHVDSTPAYAAGGDQRSEACLSEPPVSASGQPGRSGADWGRRRIVELERSDAPGAGPDWPSDLDQRRQRHRPPGHAGGDRWPGRDRPPPGAPDFAGDRV